jgi:PAS domain-containing protein
MELGLWDRTEDRDRFLEQVRTDPAGHVVLDVPARDGSRLLLRGRGEIVEIAGRRYLVSMSENVTERQQTEIALKRSEERLRLALDAARMGAWEWTIATDAVVWSERESSACGFAEGTRIETLADYLEKLHPDDRPRLRQAID